MDPLPSPEIARHFTILVYPFRHALPARDRAGWLTPLEKTWQSWWQRLGPDAREQAIDDTYFFLPHVRELLFPELFARDVSTPGAPDVKQRLGQLTLRDLARLPADALLRLTCRPNRLPAFDTLRVTLPDGGAEALRLAWVDVALFPQEVGLLMLKFELSKPVAADRLGALLAALRLVHPPMPGWTLADWRAGDGERPSFKAGDLVDFLLQGLTGPSDPLTPDLEAFLCTLPGRNRYTAGPLGQTYGEVFHLYTFACLAGPGQPDTAVRNTLYELATCTAAGNPDLRPHPKYRERLFEQHGLALWDNWQGLVLHDHAVFLGTRETAFTAGPLPRNLEGDYLYPYLVALFQKMRLSLLAGEAMRRGPGLTHNLREARRLWEAFLMFQNHYGLPELSGRPQAVEVYRCFLEGLNVGKLQERLGQEVHRLQEYYERSFERRVSYLLSLLTFIGLPTSWVIGLFSQYLVPNDLSASAVSLVSVALYAGVAALWYGWTYRRHE